MQDWIVADSLGLRVVLPEKGVDYYGAKDVPHGEFPAQWYFSKVTGAWRRCYI